jgi:hypothetical protein
VEIIEPADGAVINRRDVRVVLAAAGVEIAPTSEERSGTAHHHLFIEQHTSHLAGDQGRVGVRSGGLAAGGHE